MASTKRDSSREAFWRRIMAEFRKSGLTVREFCRRRKLHESAFYFWRRTIQDRIYPATLPIERLPVPLVPFVQHPRPRRILCLIFAADQALRLSESFAHRASRRIDSRLGGGGASMIGTTRGVRGGQVWIATAPVDMRKSFDGLAEVVRSFLGHDPLGGNVFVFRSKRGDRVKLLYWDRDGLALYYKKFESHYPHFLLFTGIGRYRDNLAYRPVTAVGMDSNPPRIGPRRRLMSEEIAVIVPPRTRFAAGP